MTSLAQVKLVKDDWRTIVICPNCREDNAPNFRFCGMCGTALDPRRAPGAPALDPLSAFPPAVPQKAGRAPEPQRSAVVENSTRTAPKDAPVSHAPTNNPPTISGPSMLGLNQPAASSNQNQSNADLLRERAFSGLDSFLEPEPPRTGRRILLIVVLLAAMGAAAWWVYTSYIVTAEHRKAETAASTTSEPSSEKPTPKPATPDATPTQGAQSSPATPSASVPEGPAENATTTPDSGKSTNTASASTPAIKPKPLTPTPATPRTAPNKRAAKSEPRVKPAPTAKPPASAAADNGDAAFRQGEAYLYGRGVHENCDQAMKYLKAASAKSNAKARSTFGTMYATGHCVPRDLPTSYTWFALALHADPNNQILEKDLSAVWNQMTPPERQLATRMKQ